jgi:hypothetical protein
VVLGFDIFTMGRARLHSFIRIRNSSPPYVFHRKQLRAAVRACRLTSPSLHGIFTAPRAAACGWGNTYWLQLATDFHLINDVLGALLLLDRECM